MKNMNTILQTAVDIALIAAPSIIVGIFIGHIRASRPKQNRKQPYPYNITR
jgi:hypothetical protein